MSPHHTSSSSSPCAPWPVAERAERTFLHGSIVQVVSGRPGQPGAVVVGVASATIRITAQRVVAVVDGEEWAWLLADIDGVFHGREDTWTIISVPDVPDHGVALRPEDVGEFRAALASALPTQAAGVRDGAGRIEAEQLSLASVPTAPPQPSGPATRLVVEHEARDARLASLEARGISAWFGSHHVLDRVSLSMNRGQVTALIGPSGCGKSTFLRILNRMHEVIPGAALAGEVRLDGDDIYDASRKLTDARRAIGMVFQKPNPFPAMSIYDNVIASFRLTGKKATSHEKDEAVETCLRKAGLWNEVRDRLRQPGASLSGGQQQRLCIARALAVRPRVLLMDEPCSALDPTSTRRIEETIVELRSEVTIVIVTHNMQQAARVSSQCAFFLAEAGTPGVIVEYGDTEAMFHAPQDERTLAYVNGRFG